MGIYIILVVVLLIYWLALYFLNWNPKIAVKSLGWMSVNDIALNLESADISIAKLKFTFNFFRSKDATKRLVNVELHDVSIKKKETKSSDKQKQQDKARGLAIDDLFQMKVSKFMYELIVVKVLNLFNVRLYHMYVNDFDSHSKQYVLVDMVRFETVTSEVLGNQITLQISCGSLQNAEGKVDEHIFRNIEGIIRYDLVTSCPWYDQGSLIVTISNISFTLSVGRIRVPFDSVAQSDEKVAKKQRNGNMVTEDNLNAICRLTNVFSYIDIMLEDTRLAYGDFELEISNVHIHQSIPGDEELVERSHIGSTLISSLYVNMLRFSHKGYVCFELPSGSLRLEANVNELLQSLFKYNNDRKFPLELVDSLLLNCTVSVTRPTIHLYYDQFDPVMRFFRIARPKAEGKSSSEFHHAEFLRVFKRISIKFVCVDLTWYLHVPLFGSTEFHRNSKLNIVVVHKILLVELKLKRDMKDKPSWYSSIEGIINIKNMRVEAVDNIIHFTRVTCLAKYNVLKNKLDLKIANRFVEMRSVNSVLFLLIRNFRNRAIKIDNETFVCANVQADTKDDHTTEGMDSVYLNLFDSVPSLINSIQVKLSSIEIDILCKDCLPSTIVEDPFTNTKIDIADFKRGLRLNVERVHFDYDKGKELLDGSILNVSLFTLNEKIETKKDFTLQDNASSSSSDFSDLSSLENESSISIENDSSHLYRRILSVRDIGLCNCRGQNFLEEESDVNKLFFKIQEIDGYINIFFTWSVIYAMYLLRFFSPTIERKCSKSTIKQIKGPPKVLNLNGLICSTTMVASLPNAVDVLLELDHMRLQNILQSKKFKCNTARLFVVQPATKLWSRFVSIIEPEVEYRKQVELTDPVVGVTSHGIEVNVPHQFLFYTVIDNLITFVKAIRQIKFNFQRSPLCRVPRLMPSELHGIMLPTINLKTNFFSLHLESDPFENELSFIFELGLLEQKERLRMQELYHLKQEQILKDASPTVDELAELMEKKPLAKHFFSGTQVGSRPRSSSHELIPRVFPPRHLDKHPKPSRQRATIDEVPTAQSYYVKHTPSEEAHKKLNEAKERLHEQFSMSWIQKYKRFRKFKVQGWKNKAKAAFGERDINPIVKKKFKILDFSPGPPMIFLLLKNIDLSIENARLDNIDDFIYKHGKGQPKLKYSILIPVYISLKCKSFHTFLRDYPLPLLSIPQNKDSLANTVDLSGNLVINEKLVHTEEEMRFIRVPFSPMVSELTNFTPDNFYSCDIPRTLSPVKVVLDMKCSLNTDLPCIVTWSKSDQPALMSALEAFDKFTKPKVDDSPLGIWDKVALIAHGKFDFDIPNELRLHIKSGFSPYDIFGKSSGFAFCWKNNVSLKFNPIGSSKQLVSLDSDEFHLGIPQFTVAGTQAWDMLNEAELMEVSRIKKHVISLHSPERVRWLLGLFFERNKNKGEELSDNQERVLFFKPHYDVCVTKPNPRWHPDSYDGFRSDYVHILLKVESKSSNGKTHNAAYFTPLAFHYFFYWWKCLKHYSPAPVRRGNLFNKSSIDSNKLKLGQHVFTVKYQLVFEPLFISHLYKHSSNAHLIDNNKTAFLGLKGNFKSCLIDLHQKKEKIRYINQKLGIDNQLMHLRMTEAGVDFVDSDIRVMEATFNEKSIISYLASSLENESGFREEDSVTSEEEENIPDDFIQHFRNIDIFENDNPWVDPGDYVEVESDFDNKIADIKLLPFFVTPRFVYTRSFFLHEEGTFPFKLETVNDFHDCLISKEEPENIEKSILEERRAFLKQRIFELKNKKPDNLGPNNENATEGQIAKWARNLQDRLNVVENTLTEFEEFEEFLNSKKFKHSSMTGSERKFSEHFADIRAFHTRMHKYHNRYKLDRPRLEWNNCLRNYFLGYLQKVSERKSEVYYMSRRAVCWVESFIYKSTSQRGFSLGEVDVDKLFKEKKQSPDDIINNFYKQLTQAGEGLEHSFNHLIEFLNPQMRLFSTRDLDACTILFSKNIELGIIRVNREDTSDIITHDESNIVSSRLGALFRDAQVFVLRKEDITSKNNASMEAMNNWPPWVTVESFYETSWIRDLLVLERNVLSILNERPNSMSSQLEDGALGNVVYLNSSKIVVNADSEQYAVLYNVVVDLLLSIKNKPSDKLHMLNKFISLTDSGDYEGVNRRLQKLQRDIREDRELILKLKYPRMILPISENELKIKVQMRLEKNKLELMLLMNSFGLRGSEERKVGQRQKSLRIYIDQIIWHAILREGEPFIDIAIAKLKFFGFYAPGGEITNFAHIGMLQSFNLQAHSRFPEIIRPLGLSKNGNENSGHDLNSDSQAISVTWELLGRKGGIAVVKHASLSVAPLEVKLDFDTAKKIHRYIFPGIRNNDDEDSKANEIQGKIENLVNLKGWKSLIPKVKSKLLSEEEFSDDSAMSISGIRHKELSSSESLILSAKKPQSPHSKEEQAQVKEELNLVMNRSSRFLSLISMEIKRFDLLVTFEAPRHLKLLNVDKLRLHVPDLKYGHQICTVEDIATSLRKDVVKIIVHHSGKILGNKFHHSNSKSQLSKPLNQVLDYVSYLSLKDLQEGGRPRDSSRGMDY